MSALHKPMITWRATHGAHKATTDQEAEIRDGVKMAFYHPEESLHSAANDLGAFTELRTSTS